jgi:hypothetical protein
MRVVHIRRDAPVARITHEGCSGLELTRFQNFAEDLLSAPVALLAREMHEEWGERSSRKQRMSLIEKQSPASSGACCLPRTPPRGAADRRGFSGPPALTTCRYCDAGDRDHHSPPGQRRTAPAIRFAAANFMNLIALLSTSAPPVLRWA